MEAVLAHPHVRSLKRLALVTDDAHGLYERYGFAPLDDVRKWMQRRGGSVAQHRSARHILNRGRQPGRPT